MESRACCKSLCINSATEFCGHSFIGSKIKRNQYRKPERNEGTKSSSKKNQSGEEGGRIFSESVEENPLKEDPILNRQFCIHSISPLTSVKPSTKNASMSSWIICDELRHRRRW
jgi:hypothetical protein